MSELNDREHELVAIGASIASNCVPCIEHHVPEARKAGLGDSQIEEAIRIADMVRRVPARKVLQAAKAVLGEMSSGPTATAATGCGCAGTATKP
jgi:AhpD family alkylhydroperoxidase